ncbi:MAG: hypothetical protein AB7S78_14140 [Candidatus Omnitrophota bacterium]
MWDLKAADENNQEKLNEEMKRLIILCAVMESDSEAEVGKTWNRLKGCLIKINELMGQRFREGKYFGVLDILERSNAEVLEELHICQDKYLRLAGEFENFHRKKEREYEELRDSHNFAWKDCLDLSAERSNLKIEIEQLRTQNQETEEKCRILTSQYENLRKQMGGKAPSDNGALVNELAKVRVGIRDICESQLSMAKKMEKLESLLIEKKNLE